MERRRPISEALNASSFIPGKTFENAEIALFPRLLKSIWNFKKFFFSHLAEKFAVWGEKNQDEKSFSGKKVKSLSVDSQKLDIKLL